MSYVSDTKDDDRFGWICYGRTSSATRVWPLMIFNCHQHAEQYCVLAYEEGKRQREAGDTPEARSRYGRLDPWRADNCDGEDVTYFTHSTYKLKTPPDASMKEVLKEVEEVTAAEYTTQLMEREAAEADAD